MDQVAGRKPGRPGRPKRIVMVCWEHLGEIMVLNSHLWKRFNNILEAVGSMEFELAMFHAAIVEVAAQNYGSRVAGASHRSNPRNH